MNIFEENGKRYYVTEDNQKLEIIGNSTKSVIKNPSGEKIPGFHSAHISNEEAEEIVKDLEQGANNMDKLRKLFSDNGIDFDENK